MAKSMAENKKYLRAILKESREALSAERAAALSARVQQRIIAADFYRNAPAVVLYAPVGNEVATGSIFDDSIAAGRQVFYPRFDSDRGALSLAPIRDLRELEPGAFGILEPPASSAIAPAGLPAGTLVCAPGIAFSRYGARLGRGGGHYDRMLSQLGSGIVTAGLAYSFQLLDSIPEGAHDRRLHFIVTEFALHEAARPAASGRGSTGEVHHRV